jgi:hypothetical protein
MSLYIYIIVHLIYTYKFSHFSLIIYINIYLIYTYRFNHLSFTIEVEDGSKENEVLFC